VIVVPSEGAVAPARIAIAGFAAPVAEAPFAGLVLAFVEKHMIKLKTGFTEYAADALADLGADVGPKVAANPKFAAITPTPADIATQVADVRQKKAGTGPGAKTALHASMATLARSLSTMATNLMEVANATATDLAGTDFPLVKGRTRTTNVPSAPINLRLKHGAVSGEVLGRCQLLDENVRSLEVQWALDPNAGPWTDGEPTTNSRAIKLDALPRGKDIWERVRARNVVGASEWSDPATIMVI
jgi:hypothetical protein